MDWWTAGSPAASSCVTALLLGLSMPLMGRTSGVAGFGLGASVMPARAAGGTIRVAQTVPAASIDPVQIADGGGITVLSQVAENLVLSAPDFTAQPLLAESWSPNQDGTVWTFKLRKGVKFHNGKEMTADDVVATFDRLADPDNGSNALSVFWGCSARAARRRSTITPSPFTSKRRTAASPTPSRPTTTTP